MKKKKILVSIPVDLLKKLNTLSRKAKLDRAAFICKMLEAKLFADEMREIYNS
jgi:metal-responsive CopG/Arc/MetJ family transcriptional regulator